MPESAEEKDNFYLGDDTDVDMWDSLSDADGFPEPKEALHSPCKIFVSLAKTILSFRY
jgi:hypothetical protein